MMAGIPAIMNVPLSLATKILVTGPPGCGKTTLVRRVLDQLGDLRVAGFYTQELRDRGRRTGFEAIGLQGSRAILAHVDFRSSHRVGRYGVDVVSLEQFIRAELSARAADRDVWVIDEIGKMECLSKLFVSSARQILTSLRPVLATVAARGDGFISEAKHLPGVELIDVSPINRDQLPDMIVERLARP
ncbi:MAG: NTPase [Planctomycetaceae bacterium]|nr:MAG: NTPase [Planctomycetaceae bacterium]